MDAPRITAVQVFNHPVLGDLEIDLHGKKHLILTGPNGSGKTSALLKLYELLNGNSPDRMIGKPIVFDPKIRMDGVLVEGTEVPAGFVLLHIAAERQAPSPPDGPAQVTQKLVSRSVLGFNQYDRPFRSFFLQHLVNRFTTMYLLRGDRDPEAGVVQAEIDRLTAALRLMFVDPGLALEYNKQVFQVNLVAGGKVQPWAQLAAGHQAILHMVAEIYAATHAMVGSVPDAGGVVLIDEPELHLHPEMQEVVLPALTLLFPDLQFIVATHAPPCISSIPDAWVYDLRDRAGIASEELMGHPYGALLRSHFKVPTDYDEATTARVEAVLERAKGVAAMSEHEKQRLRQDVEALLVTDDLRLRELWTQLILELPAA